MKFKYEPKELVKVGVKYNGTIANVVIENEDKEDEYVKVTPVIEGYRLPNNKSSRFYPTGTNPDEFQELLQDLGFDEDGDYSSENIIKFLTGKQVIVQLLEYINKEGVLNTIIKMYANNDKAKTDKNNINIKGL